MIPKDQDAPKLERLRTIQLLEADYNGYLKAKIGRQLLQRGEDKHLLGN